VTSEEGSGGGDRWQAALQYQTSHKKLIEGEGRKEEKVNRRKKKREKGYLKRKKKKRGTLAYLSGPVRQEGEP